MEEEAMTTVLDLVAQALARGDVFTLLALMGLALWKLWTSAQQASKDHQELVELVKSGQKSTDTSIRELSNKVDALEQAMAESRGRHTDVVARVTRIEDRLFLPPPPPTRDGQD